MTCVLSNHNMATIWLCRHVQTRKSSDIIFVTQSYMTKPYNPQRNHESQPLRNDLGHTETSPFAGFVAVPRHRRDWLWLCQWGPHSSSAAKDDVIGHFRFQQGCLNIGKHKVKAHGSLLRSYRSCYCGVSQRKPMCFSSTRDAH